MAAAVSDGPVGCLRSRDDVPLSRTAEFRCAGRREHDGAPGDESGFWAGFGAPAVPAGLDAVPRVRGGELRAVPRRDDRAFEARPLHRRLRRQAPPFGDGIAQALQVLLPMEPVEWREVVQPRLTSSTPTSSHRFGTADAAGNGGT